MKPESFSHVHLVVNPKKTALCRWNEMIPRSSWVNVKLWVAQQQLRGGGGTLDRSRRWTLNSRWGLEMRKNYLSRIERSQVQIYTTEIHVYIFSTETSLFSLSSKVPSHDHKTSHTCSSVSLHQIPSTSTNMASPPALSCPPPLMVSPMLSSSTSMHGAIVSGHSGSSTPIKWHSYIVFPGVIRPWIDYSILAILCHVNCYISQ